MMTTSEATVSVDSTAPVAPAEQQSPGILRLLYTHNPFYLISAGLFVYGLKKLFRDGNSAMLFDRGSVAYMEPWGLMLSLGAVTTLMAVTAVLIVRLGKVWEDARSIVLIVLLMFLAISVSFDELLNVKSDNDNGNGALSLMLLIGTSVGFALGLAEMLIRGLRIRLPWGWRFPLYAFLLMFFTYPLLLLPELVPVTPQQIRWLIAAFPVVAGLITLTLIPAVGMGSGSTHDNGTPWTWPWFPWTPFILIAGAVCFRSYSLTISFDVPLLIGHFWDTAFGVYLLVPFLLCVLVLILEIGLVERQLTVQRFAVWAAPLLLVLAHPLLVPWHHLPSYVAFTYQLTTALASPIYLTLGGLALFYFRVWYRGIWQGEVGLIAMLLLMAVVHPQATGSRLFVTYLRDFSLAPLILLTILETFSAVRRKRPAAAIVAAAAFTLVVSVLLDQTSLSRWVPLIALHCLLVTMLLMGLMFKGPLAQVLRVVGALQLSATMLLSVLWFARTETAPVWIVAYAALLTAAGFCFAGLLRERLFLVLAIAHCLLAIMVSSVWGGYTFLASTLPDGIKPIVLAAASFCAALAISLLKSGLANPLLPQRWLVVPSVVAEHSESSSTEENGSL